MAEKNTKALERVKELEASAAVYIAEIGRLQARLGELSSEVGRLRAELETRRGVRPALHVLYKTLDKAIATRIESRGYKPKARRRVKTSTISAEVLHSNDVAVLTAAARKYDTEAYFRPKSKNAGMRPGYKLLDSVYRTTRDVGVYSAKKVFRLIKRGK